MALYMENFFMAVKGFQEKGWLLDCGVVMGRLEEQVGMMFRGVAESPVVRKKILARLVAAGKDPGR